MDKYKYPRTRHLSLSRTVGDDDKVAAAEEVKAALEGKRVVITEKMDGENTTIYADGHSHARSIDSKFHPSRSIVRELAAQIAHDLPHNYRICGENIFAVHSIEYKNLASHFQVFSVWKDRLCLPWPETVEWAQLLSLTTVPVLYQGLWPGELEAKRLWAHYRAEQESLYSQTSEGFVVRVEGSFTLEQFSSSVFKYVRPNHVQTQDSTHWMNKPVVVNGLK